MKTKGEPFLNRERALATGSILTVPGRLLERWQVLAQSANGKYLLLRRMNVVGKEFKSTNDLATVPTHRVDRVDLIIESDFWLAVFPALAVGGAV